MSLEVWGPLDPAPLAEPLILAAGSRAGIDVGRLQELVAAVEVAGRSADPPVTFVVESFPGRLSVTVRPLPRGRLEGRLRFVRQLVASVDVGDDEATLHAGG